MAYFLRIYIMWIIIIILLSSIGIQGLHVFIWSLIHLNCYCLRNWNSSLFKWWRPPNKNSVFVPKPQSTWAVKTLDVLAERAYINPPALRVAALRLRLASAAGQPFRCCTTSALSCILWEFRALHTTKSSVWIIRNQPEEKSGGGTTTRLATELRQRWRTTFRFEFLSGRGGDESAEG